MAPDPDPARQPAAAPFDVVIAAAGSGIRMGGLHKAHLDLCGRPILDHALEALRRADGCRRIICVLHPDEFARGDQAQRLREVFGITQVARGGASRQESVLAGLELLPEDAEVVLIHDAARPLVSPAVVTAVADAARRWGGAIAAVPAAHTVKEVDAVGRILSTPPRHTLWFAHTPQGFRVDVIMGAHYAARKEGFTGTDDAQLVERLGGAVHVVEDSPHNMKITTPEDLIFAEAILTWRAGHPGAAG